MKNVEKHRTKLSVNSTFISDGMPFLTIVLSLFSLLESYTHTQDLHTRLVQTLCLDRVQEFRRSRLS